MSSEERTRKALTDCAYWLAYCISLGWRRDQVDGLEALWWQFHNCRGELI